MSTFTIYRVSDGAIVSHFTGPLRLLSKNTRTGHASIPGRHDPLTKRVDVVTGEVVDVQPSNVISRDAELIRSIIMDRIQEIERKSMRAQLEDRLRPNERDVKDGKLPSERLQEYFDEIASLRSKLSQ